MFVAEIGPQIIAGILFEAVDISRKPLLFRHLCLVNVPGFNFGHGRFADYESDFRYAAGIVQVGLRKDFVVKDIPDILGCQNTLRTAIGVIIMAGGKLQCCHKQKQVS